MLNELLPIFKYKDVILYLLEKYNTLIVVGETGCGKSTQIPLYLYRAGWTNEEYSIVCTQPRKVAAISIANRVSKELGCQIGEEIGYGVRFDYKCTSKTRIKYYTDGVLLRESLNDPLLSKYSVIIIDEAHQRSLNSDILLGLLKKIQRKRKDLKLIITSATLNSSQFKEYFESNSSGDPSKDESFVLSVHGRQFPVDILYLNDPIASYIDSCVQTIISIHRNEGPGDILVFLPGSEEIDMVIDRLEDKYSGNTMYFLPFYASLSNHIQMKVFEKTPSNYRKVVLATNIAESSITIENIKYVIDTGFVKLNYFDVNSGLDALITCPTSKHSAIQRAGRAGRTQPGKCFRLMTEECFTSHLTVDTPSEMQRVDITWAVLQLKALGIKDIVHFDFISPPSVNTLIYSLEILYNLGALSALGDITPLGLHMVEMPIDPKLSKCLLSSIDLGCSEDLLSIAAMTSSDYPFLNPTINRYSQEIKDKLEKDILNFAIAGSDHLTYLKVFQEYIKSGYSASWCQTNSLLPKVMHHAQEIRKNLKKVLKKYIRDRNSSSSMDQVNEDTPLSSAGDDEKSIRKCLVTGYFAQIARLKSDGQYYTLRGRVCVQPDPLSIIAKYGVPPEFILFQELIKTKSSIIKTLSKIEPLWLSELAGHYYNLIMNPDHS